ncbi:MAG: ABC transporter permease subunit, partial [Anaerolineales bacterium]|nr:ABC transporter permease subunit [Anaerolineales bacterium]
IVVGVLVLFVPLIVWSFSRSWYFPNLVPTAYSWRAWSYVFDPTSRVWPALVNSFVVATAVTLFSILIGLPAGRALGLHNFRGKTLVEFLILMPTIVPVLAAAFGIHVMFIRYGLADTLAGVILVHLIPVTPYMVLILSSIFANYDVDYEAQAQSLGARPWQRFVYITLPAIFPGLVVGSLFAFIISWSQYLLTLLIGGGQVQTLPVMLFAFASSGDYAITAALSLVFIGPAILFLLITTRYLTGENAALGGFGKI